MQENQERNETSTDAPKKRSFIKFLRTIYSSPFYALFGSVVLFLECLTMIAIALSFIQLVGNYGWTNIALLLGLILLALLCLVGIVIATKMAVRRIRRRDIARTEDSNGSEEPHIIRRLIYYASENAVFAEWVSADLQSRGISCTLIQIGSLGEEEKHPLIFLRGYDQLLLVFSQQARSNAWNERLVDTALRLEILRGRATLFLLDMEESAGIDTGVWSTTRFRSHKREDFIGWKDPSLYRQSLDRLIADLRGTTSIR